MTRVLLGLARFALSAWVGAASLFVVTGVSEVRAPELDSFVRDVLVGVRFPAYYLFGFTLVGLACLCLFASRLFAASNSRIGLHYPLLIFFAVGVMVGDYIFVYQPLIEMITPPGQSRPFDFQKYHAASKWLNLFTLSLCAIVAMLLCMHGKRNDTETPAAK